MGGVRIDDAIASTSDSFHQAGFTTFATSDTGMSQDKTDQEQDTSPEAKDAADAPAATATEEEASGEVRATELEQRVKRQFLHAAELVFMHPVSGEKMHHRAPLPPDLQAVVDWAEAGE